MAEEKGEEEVQQFRIEEEGVQQPVVEKREEVQRFPMREGVHQLLMEEGEGVQQSMREEEEKEEEEEEEEEEGVQQSMREEEEKEEEEEEEGVRQSQMEEEGVQRSPTVVVGEEHRVLDTETGGSELRRPDSPQFYLQEFDVR